MKIKLYQVDAFTTEIGRGNPAAVCPLGSSWLADSIMQRIANENNLSETAFYIKNGSRYSIRWFTPTVEVDLCGHATLASAHVLFNHEKINTEKLEFDSKSGLLSVTQNADWLTLNFPTDQIEQADLSDKLWDGFDLKPEACYRGKSDLMLIYADEAQIRNIKIKRDKIAALPARGVIITARGEQTDFVSRFFAPQSGIDEDPVTGSAHTTLTPYWHQCLHKTEFTARQLSAREGYLKCRYLNDRTEISGQAVTYLTGEITVPS